MNPFAHPMSSTTHTIWSLDPIYLANKSVISMIREMATEDNPGKVKGLFGDAIKWLLKNVGIKAIDDLSKTAHKWIDKRVTAKGLPQCPPYDFIMSRNSEDEDIEENPGPDNTRSSNTQSTRTMKTPHTTRSGASSPNDDNNDDTGDEDKPPD